MGSPLKLLQLWATTHHGGSLILLYTTFSTLDTVWGRGICSLQLTIRMEYRIWP